MHINISLTSDRNIILPIQYNHILQGFIYKNIDDDLAEFLHNEGYIIDGRSFKLFTFSRILNRGRKENDKFNFGNRIRFMVSSPLDTFCKSIANAMLLNSSLILGQNSVSVDQIQILNNKAKKDEIIIETLSSIVAYSTLLRPDGSKYTCYFMPGESDFERIVSDNIIKKYRALNKIDNTFEKGISITSLGDYKLSLVKYKDFIVKGASGKFLIEGDKRLLQIGLDAGIGGKNSQGFGCVSLVEGR